MQWRPVPGGGGAAPLWLPCLSRRDSCCGSAFPRPSAVRKEDRGPGWTPSPSAARGLRHFIYMLPPLEGVIFRGGTKYGAFERYNSGDRTFRNV
ncbi:hypothetical protein NDU88_007129 [Pleurodeles waltl]|uniref:Secreted protein n=1 Tax=Pleurodeles waltl TaxID=8319 RepID=A0AAV7MFG4_PLEWA|nr:hypothetical protein NDU88_007129 [Pleurodeles waltl]